jgi:hypothetical protein
MIRLTDLIKTGASKKQKSSKIFEAVSGSPKLNDILMWLKKHRYKVTDSEQSGGIKKWAEGGDWDDLVKDAKSIGAEYRKLDLGSYKEHQIEGNNFSIKKLGNKEILLHFTPNKKDSSNRKLGFEY